MNAPAEAAAPWLLMQPELLLLALALPLLFLLRRRPPALPVAGVALALPLPATWRVRLRALPRIVEAAGLLCGVVALARPVVRRALPVTRRGSDVLLCLDVSSSMGTKDLDPARSRLAVARAAAERFVSARPDDHIGLVRFARFPDLVCPPTLDHEALREFLGEVEPVAADGPEDATGIGAAVARAAQVLRSSTANAKVVIVLTDGEENVFNAGAPDEIAPLHAAQLCSAVGARAYAIHVAAGDESGAASGGARSLKQMAERTGGAFFSARDASSLAAVYARIDELEREEPAPPRYRFEERFIPLLITALLLVVGGRLAATSRLGVVP
jgi:Ca-activated chloride channel family protein